jgi:hypothetical protein
LLISVEDTDVMNALIGVPGVADARGACAAIPKRVTATEMATSVPRAMEPSKRRTTYYDLDVRVAIFKRRDPFRLG